MTRLPLILALCAAPTMAQEPLREWTLGGTRAWIELQEPQAPGATATVTFYNDTAHSGDATFALTRDGFAVTVEMEWEVDGNGSERITVTPPEGFVAVPVSVTVGEGQTGVVHIYTLGLLS